MRPVKIRIPDKKNLLIKWDDGSESKISLEKMRRLCPCATCITERENESKTYIPLFFKAQIEVEEVKPIGNYAVSVKWKDGHSSGIYEYTYLKKLAAN